MYMYIYMVLLPLGDVLRHLLQQQPHDAELAVALDRKPLSKLASRTGKNHLVVQKSRPACVSSLFVTLHNI